MKDDFLFQYSSVVVVAQLASALGYCAWGRWFDSGLTHVELKIRRSPLTESILPNSLSTLPFGTGVKL